MEFPPAFILNSSLEVGRIYYISAPELIDIHESHYFVVIAILEDQTYLLVSTTQLNKRISFLQRRNIPEDTLCYIAPSEENMLTKDSYLDCNKYFEVKNEFLMEKIEKRLLETKGVISDEDFEKIRRSIEQSPLFDLPIDMIVK